MAYYCNRMTNGNGLRPLEVKKFSLLCWQSSVSGRRSFFNASPPAKQSSSFTNWPNWFGSHEKNLRVGYNILCHSRRELREAVLKNCKLASNVAFSRLSQIKVKPGLSPPIELILRNPLWNVLSLSLTFLL